MERRNCTFSSAILSGLRDLPLLVGDLEEAKVWKRAFRTPDDVAVLNFDQKLGHLYEDAFERLIQMDAGLELLARNLQVPRADGSTLGEIDFLIRDRASGLVTHVELAVKFYLSFVDGSCVERFPGPDPRDNWLNKLDRLRSRQLRLGRLEETKALLKERFGVEEVAVGQRIYGALFDRFDREGHSRPPSVRAGCVRGCWLYFEELDRCFGGRTEFFVLPKCLWGAKIDERVLAELDRVSVEELGELATERCVMLWDEVCARPVFVAPRSWPGVGA
ncbi:DUF1853 family protein [Pelagicoccus mobilis]|uniref:DUF1853 family protein n=1 Tax=Pelagicoccus mobilis TaxID=415221 RepID=A0A934S2T7_9BACT|nr:DUF1853 family protein [Pelagicoccus mobilis]MBK1879616.1 DUF1853 family protein [Pelagicoccus mobilis]